MADYKAAVPVTPETPFCIASVNKSMTVAVAVGLLEEGKIALGDSLERFFPGFPRGGRITFEHVLRHRAGFPHRVTEPEEEATPLTSAEMVERVRAHVAEEGFLCEPGEESNYSSAGYSLAARMCELASGEDFGALLARFVYEPAGMTHSFHPAPDLVIPPRARSYLNQWPGVRDAPDKHYSFLVGAGSVFSTARDLSRFLHAIVDTVYSPLVLASLMKEKGLENNGITNGYRAFADYHKDGDLYVVFTGNRHTGATDRMRKDIPRIAAGEDVPVPERIVVEQVPLAEEVLHRFEGSWVSETGSDFDITAEDGQLMAGGWALIPTSETTFFSPQDYADVEFELEEGRPVRLLWETGGDPLVWTRVEEE